MELKMKQILKCFQCYGKIKEPYNLGFGNRCLVFCSKKCCDTFVSEWDIKMKKQLAHLKRNK